MNDLNDSIQRKEKKLRNQRALGWFLTYPKCDLSPRQLLEALQEKSRTPIREYLIAQEQHADDTYHLHAFIQYEKKVEWASDRWDIGNYHGNY